MGVSKYRGTPKWIVYNGKPYFSMEDLGGENHYFWKHPYATFEDLDVEAQRGGRWQGPTTRKCLWSVWMPRGFSAEGMMKRIFHKGFSECLKLGTDDFKKHMTFHDFSTWHLFHSDTQWVGSLAYASVFCFRSSTLGTTSTSSRLARSPESCALAWWVYVKLHCAHH